MSAGPTTRRIGRVSRSCSRRASSWSPSSEADSGVSTNPAAIRFTRIGATSSARFFVSAGIAAVSAPINESPGAVRRPPVPPMNSSVPPALTRPDRVPGDLHRQQQVGLDVAPGLVEVEVLQERVVRAGAGDEDVVDRPWELLEEALEAVEVGDVEGRGRGLELARRPRSAGPRCGP